MALDTIDDIRPTQPLVFVRHGETDWNQAGRFQGHSNTNLSSKGIEQAVNNSRQLEDLIQHEDFPTGHLHLVSSPLARTRQTAEIFARTCSRLSPARFDPAFQELALGRWEGLTSAEVKDKYYDERKRRKSSRWQFSPLGGSSLADRLEPVRKGLFALPPGAVVITHCGVIRILLHLLASLSQEEAAQTTVPHLGLWLWDGQKFCHKGG